MTGEKNRFTTTEKLWKLNDETLSTPEHDEMVMWLLNKENCILSIPKIKEFLDNNLDWTTSTAEFQEKIPDFWNRLKEKKGIEDIKGRFIDCFSDVWLDLIYEFHKSQEIKPCKDILLNSETPIMGNNKFIIGYWDLIIRRITRIGKSKNFIRWCGKEGEQDTVINNNFRSIFIEVKPKIKSFGETLRQIKTYQVYDRESSGYTYLFTKDIKFKDAFESQGIAVIDANQWMR